MRTCKTGTFIVLIGTLAFPVACDHELAPDAAASREEEPPPPPAALYVDESGDDERFVTEDMVFVPRTDAPSNEEAGYILSSVQSRRTVYLNRFGGTYYAGADNASTNRSSIISGTRTVGGYQGSDIEWAAIVSCVEHQYARYDVDIVTEDPGSAPHVEAVVGGRPSDIGRSNIGGVSPVFYDCGTVERAVNYTFTEGVSGTRWICETVAHEVGHALGLQHAYKCEDPMTYLDGCGLKTFQDEYTYCGTYSSESCRCGAQQNTHSFLSNRLGTVDAPTPTTACNNTCEYAFDGECDDGGQGAQYDGCGLGTDCGDCGARDTGASDPDPQPEPEPDSDPQPEPDPQDDPTDGLCTNTCPYASDGECDDGGEGSLYDVCGFGTDCADCGARTAPDDEPEPPPTDLPPTDLPPEVTVQSPAPNASVLGGDTVDVVATVTDDVTVATVELLWQYQTLFVLDCDNPPAVATCSHDGGTYTWTVRVGTGARSFRVRATDSAGNVTETAEQVLELTNPEAEDPTPAAPEVVVTSPGTGATFSPGDTVHIEVLASDASGIADADLWWVYPGGAYYHFQLHELADGTWGIDLTISPQSTGGQRSLRIAVKDADGNQTVAPDTSITITP